MHLRTFCRWQCFSSRILHPAKFQALNPFPWKVNSLEWLQQEEPLIYMYVHTRAMYVGLVYSNTQHPAWNRCTKYAVLWNCFRNSVRCIHELNHVLFCSLSLVPMLGGEGQSDSDCDWWDWQWEDHTDYTVPGRRGDLCTGYAGVHPATSSGSHVSG